MNQSDRDALLLNLAGAVNHLRLGLREVLPENNAHLLGAHEKLSKCSDVLQQEKQRRDCQHAFEGLFEHAMCVHCGYKPNE